MNFVQERFYYNLLIDMIYVYYINDVINISLKFLF